MLRLFFCSTKHCLMDLDGLQFSNHGSHTVGTDFVLRGVGVGLVYGFRAGLGGASAGVGRV